MLRESSLNHRLLTALRKFPLTVAERVENACAPGTPDVCVLHRGVYAWVENKSLSGFPVRPTTPVRIPHFKPEQRLWLLKHGEAGGRCFLFVAVGEEMFLFDWRAAQVVDTWPRDVWRARAVWRYAPTQGKVDWKAWIKEVCG